MNPGNKSPAQAGRPLSPSPLSRPLAASSVPVEGLDVVVCPTEEELRGLARENGLVAVEKLEARLHVSPCGKDGLIVTGRLLAQIRQTCVVTLEEFDSNIDEDVRLRFAPPGAADGAAKTGDLADVGLDAAFDVDNDAPDPLIGGVVDLGAVVCEFFTLALDPYPRRPGAQFTEPAPAKSEDGLFAALLRAAKPKAGGD